MSSQPAPHTLAFCCELLWENGRCGQDLYSHWSSVGSLLGPGSILTLRSTMMTTQITVHKVLTVFFSINNKLCLIEQCSPSWGTKM